MEIRGTGRLINEQLANLQIRRVNVTTPNQRLSFALKYEILPLILIFLPLNLRQGSQTFAANIDG